MALSRRDFDFDAERALLTYIDALMGASMPSEASGPFSAGAADTALAPVAAASNAASHMLTSLLRPHANNRVSGEEDPPRAWPEIQRELSEWGGELGVKLVGCAEGYVYFRMAQNFWEGQ